MSPAFLYSSRLSPTSTHAYEKGDKFDKGVRIGVKNEGKSGKSDVV